MELRDDVHVSAVVIEAPLELVWEWVTEPMRFPTLYPGWTSSVQPRSDGGYDAVGPAGGSFRIVPVLSFEHGVVDFEIVEGDGKVELSRMRVCELKRGGCALVHLGVRFDSDNSWEEHKDATDVDFLRVKQIVESAAKSESPLRTAG